MEPSKEAIRDGSDKPRRVIKRYSNRKLYDTRDSRYVTLQQIGEMVRAGEEVQIIDNKTKEDKTEVTLALILSEDLKAQPRSVPLGALRELIQERGGRLLNQLREGPIGRLIPGGDGTPGSEAVVEEKPPAAVSPEPEKSAEKLPTKGRLTELVESSWTTVDERIRAILPSLKAFSELESEVKRLALRVDALETELAAKNGKTAGQKSSGSGSSGPATGGSGTSSHTPSGDRLAK